jgi:Cell wall-associated hydrolases (invasion-associated proteins)
MVLCGFLIASFMKCVNMSTVDLRTEPKFRSERNSQLIYGESITMISESGDYYLVEGVDKVRGYVMKNLITDCDEKKYLLRKNFRSRHMVFPFGSHVNDEEISFHNIPDDFIAKNGTEYKLTDLAQEFVGVPYLWGGTSDLGYDCSGFTQRLFRFCGVEIPRNSSWQREASFTIDDFDHAKPGDLIFYTGHVTIYLGDHRIIHANVHNGGVSYTDLNDGSTYSKYLANAFEKIGRLELKDKYDLPFIKGKESSE